ncbi:ABC transporter permease/M1 family aminopeptidase [Dokdonella koreensis]|uniref:Membrane protein n=1 Tax=Dokdonella koreensis DS-123 TaxID=1300342 RepID=A0A160DT00_9GAMM|nr:M1 family aminopeptidase [Dokdonella koreensis]ANB17458.1 Membrane protein [Dokdonella koreensis DS-123]
MLRHLLQFERRLLLGSGLFWIVALVYGAIGFATMASDNVSFGGGVGNVLRNAPAVVVTVLGSFSVISVLLATIFVAGIALRDFEQGTAELFFVTPMKRRDYLLGRFGGGLLASVGIMVTLALGLWVGTLMPWLDAARLGPTPWSAYLWSFVVLVIPNLLFVSALMFLLATATRSMLYTYLGVIAFFVLWQMSDFLTRDLDSRWIAALVDPSGSNAIYDHMRYWSSAELNSKLPDLTGLLLANRALWLVVTALMLAAAFVLFRSDREGLVLRRRKAVDTAPAASAAVAVALPQVVLRTDRAAQWKQYLHQAAFDLRGALTGAPFLVMLLLGLLLTFSVLKFSGMMYGTEVYPVTRQMLTTISGSLNLFLIIIVTFYAGELIWRERTMRVSEATDAFPVPNWVPLAGKLTALLGIVVVFFAAGSLFTMGYQVAQGYTQLEPLLYLKGLLLEALPFVLMAVLAVFLQVVSGNKFLGYLLMIVYLVGRTALAMNDFDHLLYRYGGASPTPYSDMNGYGHFIGPHLWFRAYWGAFALALLALAAAFWPRGTSLAWKDRVREARARLRHGPGRFVLAAGLAAFVALGGWIFYNTNVLNDYVPGDLAEQRQADYEKTYRQYKDMAKPRITAIRSDVDIYPDARKVAIRGHYTLVNKTAETISELHVTLDPRVEVKRLDFGPHSVVKADTVHGYTIYRLDTPLPPGASMDFAFELASEPHGFPLNGGDTQVVDNGTFFNNMALPQFGYAEGRQLTDRNDRRKYGLPDLPRMPKIDDEAARANTYISDSADWVDFETIVSTAGDQIALAPGYLQREWTEGGRRFFHYKSEAKLLPFFSWLSARWQVKRDAWNGIPIEIYYDAKHPYNVDRMIESTKKSLEYFTRNFSPYQFRQFRILEFPGYASFAQAFAGTIPYSESIGFIADLRDKEDIDYVFYVTAHEAAHQWWAHQVIGANVQGATMLSESLAQYSALMVMEHEYGPQKMRKFLKYELDRYLMSRATERVEELPLALNENQDYIHYRKGSVVFYALRDMIGEDTLNAVLARFLKDKGFQQPPYTTTREFLAYLREGTDPKFHPFIENLFEKITFWDNRAVEANAVKREDGKYTVTLKLHSAMLQTDGKGAETEATLDQWVDIGVFARPPGGKESDETVLYLQKHHVTEKETTLELVVDGEPFEAGIDPYNKLVDRSSEDNRKRVSIK